MKRPLHGGFSPGFQFKWHSDTNDTRWRDPSATFFYCRIKLFHVRFLPPLLMHIFTAFLERSEGEPHCSAAAVASSPLRSHSPVCTLENLCLTLLGLEDISGEGGRVARTDLHHPPLASRFTISNRICGPIESSGDASTSEGVGRGKCTPDKFEGCY